MSPRRQSLLLALAWFLALAGGAVALQRPAPLFLNLGAGDQPFARGFRGGWERDGLQGSGETMFHWTTDGARLEFPVTVRAGVLTARMRLARFLDTPIDMTVQTDGRVVDEWTQRPRGWTIRELELGEVRGPLSLRFRSSGPGDLGIALDWIEVRQARALWPASTLVPGLLALLFGVPLLVAICLGPRTALVFGLGIAALATGGILLDRLGGLCAAAGAGAPTLLVVGLLGLLDRAVGKWAPVVPNGSGLAVAVVASVLALTALSHPFYYYPDVDTHSRFVAALREDPALGLDPRSFQEETGAWTRQIGGQRVAFPYSPVFHLLALPVGRVLGDVPAVKAVGVLALGVALVLVHALAGLLGLEERTRVVAQVLFCLIPVTASRLTLALFPTLLGQALELLVVVVLAQRFADLEGSRDTWAMVLLLGTAQAAYTGSLFGVGAVVVCFAGVEWGAGERARVGRLLTAYVLAAAAVVGLLYRHFLPVLFQQLVPNAATAATGSGETQSAFTRATTRLGLFYDLVYPLLLLPGLVALRSAPVHARRAAGAMLLAAGSLLSLRYLLPALFRDVKEVELLVGPVAIVSAAALGWLWNRGSLGRAVGLAAAFGALHFGLTRTLTAYAERFLAVGR